MLTAILPNSNDSIKDQELNQELTALLTADYGSLVIRIGLSGLRSVHIDARDSSVEAELLDLWRFLRPALTRASEERNYR